MTTLSISISDEARAFIESRVQSGAYKNASDYISDLIAREQQELDRLLIEGLNSGPSEPLDMDSIREEARALFAARKK